jgi:uncharacterized membrane protein YjgN (DUF898 family)
MVAGHSVNPPGSNQVAAEFGRERARLGPSGGDFNVRNVSAPVIVMDVLGRIRLPIIAIPSRFSNGRPRVGTGNCFEGDAMDILPPAEVSLGRKEPLDITFENRGDRLIGLGFINGILKVLTLGLYGFWGKTEVRRRIWSFTRINGEPLTYTGTGKELFLGFLIAFGCLILPLFIAGVAISMLFGGSQAALGAYQAFVYFVIFFLIGNAMYRAQRYRLSRTTWRGIRGALAGSPQSYGWTYFWTLALPLALVAGIAGLAAWLINPNAGGAIGAIGAIAALWVFPWRSNKLQKLLTNDMRFGDRPLTYTGTSGPLYKRYVFAWAGSALLYVLALAATASYVLKTGLMEQLEAKIPPTGRDFAVIVAIWALALLTVAMITAWYRASQMNHFARNTHFEGATFRLDAKGSGLMWLVLSNWLITTLGFIAGLVLGIAIVMTSGVMPAAVEGTQVQQFKEQGLLPILMIILPTIVLSTVTATFAQFRSVRYFMARLKLDGPIVLAQVLQSAHKGPKRGEGLAQVFDIDAF